MSDDDTAAAIDRLTETLRAQLDPPPGTDLAAIIGRLADVSGQIQQIAADVMAHGVAIGQDAVSLIGSYALAWFQLADGVRRAAEQDGLIDAWQLLDVMQELNDRFGLGARPLNGRTETTP